MISLFSKFYETQQKTMYHLYLIASSLCIYWTHEVSSSLLGSIDVIDIFHLSNHSYFAQTQGFCSHRLIDGNLYEDTSFVTLKPFSASKVIDGHFNTNQISILATIKLVDSLIDEFYLLQFVYSDKWVGIRIGTTIFVDFYLKKLYSYKFNYELKDNSWHRLTFSVENTTLEFFADCEFVGRLNIDVGFFVKSSEQITLHIGNPENKKFDFQGFLQDLRVFPDKRSAPNYCAVIMPNCDVKQFIASRLPQINGPHEFSGSGERVGRETSY